MQRCWSGLTCCDVTADESRTVRKCCQTVTDKTGNNARNCTVNKHQQVNGSENSPSPSQQPTTVKTSHSCLLSRTKGLQKTISSGMKRQECETYVLYRPISTAAVWNAWNFTSQIHLPYAVRRHGKNSITADLFVGFYLDSRQGRWS